MKSWIIAASSALFVAGCGGGAATNNGVAEAPANGVAENNAAAPAAAAANVAIGRWVQASGRCDEMADVEFTPTLVRMFSGSGALSVDIPITYSEATATSVTMQAEAGQPAIVATLTDPTHLALTSPGRPERNCTLVRR